MSNRRLSKIARSLPRLETTGSPLKKELTVRDLSEIRMTEIRPYLYLGNHIDSGNLENLEKCGITRVLNVSRTLDNCFPEKLKYHRIAINDSFGEPLLTNLEISYNFIKDTMDNNEKVLVHCYGGISRSAAIVIGFLMKYESRGLMDVYKEVKNIRSVISCNLDFMGQLMMYEKSNLEDMIRIRAYYLSQANPDNSMDDNWLLAESEIKTELLTVY